MGSYFNPTWNPHYNFEAPASKAEIAAVDTYRLESDPEGYKAKQLVDSPWGINKVIEVRHQDGQDICIKTITVKPGYMLSLQRHRGRAELWEVTQGVLTVIMDGVQEDIPAGQSLILPKGAVHCMINSSNKPVTVRETQVGICREKDSVRLLDFSNRPTYPLTSELEFRLAKLYASIQAEHIVRYGFGARPAAELLQSLD